MIANRILASAACVPLLAAVAVGQSYTAPPPPTHLTAAEGTWKPFAGSWPAPTALFPGKGSGVRPASATELQPPLTVPPAATPVDTLTVVSTAMPTLPPVPNAVPGAVYSPWCGDSFAGGCDGPVGANGPVTYEGYFRTGPTLLSGGGTMTAVAKTFGWNVQGGSRSLFFNPTGDAAWVIDLGIGHTQNEGRGAANPLTLLTGAVKFGAAGGTFDVGLTKLRRTSLNFGFGRDFFLNGPGVVGCEPGYSNFRMGWDVGGRWGTASADFEPFGDPGGFRRRHGIYHGVYGAGQASWELPMGGWTMFIGGRIEWGYYWTNMIPPNDGDFRDLNLLLMTGVRF